MMWGQPYNAPLLELIKDSVQKEKAEDAGIDIFAAPTYPCLLRDTLPVLAAAGARFQLGQTYLSPKEPQKFLKIKAVEQNSRCG